MKPRIPKIVHLPVSFHAKRDHIVAIFYAGGSTIGVRFQSPEQLLELFSQMMEKAVLVWPENEWIKEYLRP
jgi:hypothetical protein